MLPPALFIYRTATFALTPLAPALIAWRLRRGKEDPGRFAERMGMPGLARPPGRLVWLHGASVGESAMLVALLEALKRARPEIRALVTTQTRTSADLLSRRLSPYAVHQYAPIDAPGPMRRFLAHWRPDLAVFAESEIWPNMLLDTAKAGIPAALVNARMSARSLANWARAPRSARQLLDSLGFVAAADQRTSEGLTLLTGRSTPMVGNLKLSARPPACDEQDLRAFKAALGDRPVWLAASTHPGEEDVAVAAHERVRTTVPGALLIIAPRHPDRADSIMQGLSDLGDALERRRTGALPQSRHSVYLADTLGEMGLWLRLASCAFIGGSLTLGIGGHTPVEPAQLDCPMITGPHVSNFEELYAQLAAAQAVARVCDPVSLAEAVRPLLADPLAARAMAARARAATAGGDAALAATLQGLLNLCAQRWTQ
jgi:3-deoxy-D-manno-octulosonic-acid transferase